jgi:hypothetical protein
MWISFFAALLTAGTYDGVSEAGSVRLTLREDGTARFGGAECRWASDEAALTLDCATDTYVLRGRAEGGTIVLAGPPFGTLRLRPAADPAERAPAPPPLPAAFVGTWGHTASGGTLTLRLAGDGTFEMRQAPLGAGEPVVTRGRWSGDDGALVLQPDGGRPLRYRATALGDRLRVGGGDLPTDVDLLKMAADPAAPL